MDNNLRSCLGGNPAIPLSQPYNTLPWSYSGNENMGSLPNDMVDWIFIKVVDQQYASVFESAGILYKDGSVKSTSGNNEICFNYTGTDQLKLIIEHRNFDLASAPANILHLNQK